MYKRYHLKIQSLKSFTFYLGLLFVFIACGDTTSQKTQEKDSEILKESKAYGFDLNQFNTLRDTIKNGDTFGAILNNHGVSHTTIFNIATKFRDTFDVRRLVVGKPYLVLKSKDTLNTIQYFVYEKNKIQYAVVDLSDSLRVYTKSKPITYVDKQASGVIENSLYLTMEENNLSPAMTDRLANIYA